MNGLCDNKIYTEYDFLLEFKVLAYCEGAPCRIIYIKLISNIGTQVTYYIFIQNFKVFNYMSSF
jgi:hypothetical protein